MRATWMLLLALATGLVACGDDDGMVEPDAATTMDASRGDAGGGDDAGPPDAGGEDASCPDADGDGVCDADDVCINGPDALDADEDGTPDACDACAGSVDADDADEDGVPDGCDCDTSAGRCATNASCSESDVGVVCTCDEGYAGEGETACEPVDCGGLDAPTDGGIVIDATTFGASARFSCDAGFTLVGAVERVCQADGTWSGEVAFCSSIDCGELAAPTNGSVAVPSTGFSATATYACDPGYLLEGDGARTCQMSGTWSGSAPTCRLVECGALAPPVEGTVMVDRTTLGGTATYACNEGWTTMDPLTRTCGVDGSWSGSAPTCGPVDCGPLMAPTNGAVGVASTTFGSIAMYSCDDGFELVGVDTRECQATGVWSGAPPSCVSDTVDCGSPPSATGATVSLSAGTTEGSVATYTCERGRRLLGGSRAICTSAGTWLGAPAVCAEPITCQCSGQFAVGEPVEAAVANPRSARDLPAGTIGRTIAAATVVSALLVRWSGWTNGHTGNCTAAACGACTTSRVNDSWYVGCADVTSRRLTCACEGAYSPGDRVVALYDSPESADGVSRGQLGTVIAADNGSNRVLIEWDGWEGGHDGRCFAADCGPCTARALRGRWYTSCDQIGRAP